MSRCDEYRDLLEHWAAWWNGPGRRYYDFGVNPPIEKTGNALACSVCSGEHVCGRRMDVR